MVTGASSGIGAACAELLAQRGFVVFGASRNPEFRPKAFRGIRTYDVTDPGKVALLQEFSTGDKGAGTHMNFYDGGKYAYLDCGWDDQLRLEATERPYGNALMIVIACDGKLSCANTGPAATRAVVPTTKLRRSITFLRTLGDAPSR